MAARVGTGVTGSFDTPGAASIVSAEKSTTTGNILVAFFKWEGVTPQTMDTITDTAGNTWVIAEQGSHATDNEPRGALCYALNITANAANVVTGNLTGTVIFGRVCVEEFSGVATASATDGAAQEATGSGTTFSTSDITTTQSGLVVLGVAGFTSLSSHSGTAGNPDFSIGANISDTFVAYLLSGAGQTVTPAATATGNNRWYAAAQAWKDAAGAAAYNAVPLLHDYYRMISG